MNGYPVKQDIGLEYKRLSGAPAGAHDQRVPALSYVALVTADVAVGLLVATVALERSGGLARFLLPVFFLTVFPVALLGLCYGYQLERLREAPARMLARLLGCATACVWLCTLVANAVGVAPGYEQALLVWLLLPVGWLLARLAMLGPSAQPRRMLFVGERDLVEQLMGSLHGSGASYEQVGFLGDGGDVSSLPRLGPVDFLPHVLASRPVDRVVIAAAQDHGQLPALLRTCEEHDVPAYVVSPLFEIMGLKPQLREVGNLPAFSVGHQRSNAQLVTKRALDVVVASLLLFFLAPALGLIALVIFLDDGGPVFFRQQRIGRNRQPFSIMKFRSMTNRIRGGTGAEFAQLPLADRVRLLKEESANERTRVGEFLRRTSLDELPQLVNVVRGNMSLIGPRPLQAYEANGLEEWEQRRHQVRPGITGLWQVRGRSNLSWAERMLLDWWYVRDWSLLSDLEIAFRTLPAVVRRRGAL